MEKTHSLVPTDHHELLINIHLSPTRSSLEGRNLHVCFLQWSSSSVQVVHVGIAFHSHYTVRTDDRWFKGEKRLHENGKRSYAGILQN